MICCLEKSRRTQKYGKIIVYCFCLQSRYFDCEYDQENEQEKTDGGLGAGTPMFLSEVMHGSTCTLI